MKVVAKVKHTFYVQYFFFLSKLRFLWDYLELYGGAGCALDDSVAYAHLMATNTLRICHKYCFSSSPWLDEGAAMLSFMHTVFIVSYSSYMMGKYVKYLLMESE